MSLDREADKVCSEYIAYRWSGFAVRARDEICKQKCKKWIAETSTVGKSVLQLQCTVHGTGVCSKITIRNGQSARTDRGRERGREEGAGWVDLDVVAALEQALLRHDAMMRLGYAVDIERCRHIDSHDQFPCQNIRRSLITFEKQEKTICHRVRSKRALGD